MKEFNDKNINNDKCICDNYNTKYESYCLTCDKHLCIKCLKTRKHVNHKKKIISEMQPNEKELNKIKENIEKYEEKIETLEKNIVIKTKELNDKLQESKNKIIKRKDLAIKDNEGKMEKELKIKTNEYILEIRKNIFQFENDMKKIKYNYKKNINVRTTI